MLFCKEEFFKNSLINFFSEAKVKKLILTHFVPPSFDEEKLENEVRDIYKGDIVIGKDLLNLEV